jgi:hypothetical protein
LVSVLPALKQTIGFTFETFLAIFMNSSPPLRIASNFAEFFSSEVFGVQGDLFPLIYYISFMLSLSLRKNRNIKNNFVAWFRKISLFIYYFFISFILSSIAYIILVIILNILDWKIVIFVWLISIALSILVFIKTKNKIKLYSNNLINKFIVNQNIE